MKRNDIIKGALASGVLNAVINGIINWFMVRDTAEILLAQDLISSHDKTIFAGIVPLATSLAFILTTVSYFTIKMKDKPKYFPKVFLWALRNTIFAFGLIVAIAVVIQRVASDVTATPLVSAILAGITAGVVGAIVDYMTKSQIADEKQIHNN